MSVDRLTHWALDISPLIPLPADIFWKSVYVHRRNQEAEGKDKEQKPDDEIRPDDLRKKCLL
jgi:hypothetical protein